MLKEADKGIAGFSKLTPEAKVPEKVRWTAEPGILEGSRGVALALLAAITNIEPTWDRMLLASIPG